MKVKTIIKAGRLEAARGRVRKATSLIALSLVLFLVALVPAQAQLNAGLAVSELSIHSTLPDSTGARQVTVSCTVTNTASTRSSAATALVSFGAVTNTLTIPSLKPSAVAYVASTLGTAEIHFTISVTLSNNASSSYDFNTNVPAGRWQSLGPSVIVNDRGGATGVGRITTIAIDPSAPGTLYAGAHATGVWKTTDSGAHWEPLTDALPTVNIAAIAVDPAVPRNVYVVAVPGVYGSSDGGHVWTLLNSEDLQAVGSDGGALIVRHLIPVIFGGANAAAPVPASSASANAASAQSLPPFPFPWIFQPHLYLSTRTGLRISLDSGVTWGAPVLSGVIPSLVPDQSNPYHFLATVIESGNAGVYETFVGGFTAGSWTKLQGCPGAPLPAIPSTGVGLWVAQSGVTQWVSLKKPGDVHELWRTSSSACLVNGRFERVWQLLSSGNATPCVGPASAGVNSEWSYLAADPKNSQILYKGGVHLCRSTDAGSNFTRVDFVHDDHHAIAFDQNVSGRLYIGNDGGMWQSNDSGANFQFNAQGLSVTEFLEVDAGGTSPYSVVGGSQDNALAGGDEVSPVWKDISLGADPDGDRSMAVIDPKDRTVQFSVGQAVDHFSRTQNGLRDENFDYSGLPVGCITYDESPTRLNQFIATTSTNFHLLTTVGPPRQNGPGCNGGLWSGPPWHPLFAPSGGEALVRVTYDDSIGLFLAGGNNGSVYINFSPDFMTSVWQAPAGSVTSIVANTAQSASYFVALNIGGFNSGSGRIFEIHADGILHFVGTDITANVPSGLVMTLASNPFEPNVLYAGTRGNGVQRGVRDVNGQWTWQPFNNGIPRGANVTKLEVDRSTGTIHAGTYGRGAFALPTVSIF